MLFFLLSKINFSLHLSTVLVNFGFIITIIIILCRTRMLISIVATIFKVEEVIFSIFTFLNEVGVQI